MARERLDNTALEQGLQKDVAEAREISERVGSSVGERETGDFDVKSLKIKGRTVQAKEIKDLEDSFNFAIKELTRESGIVDDIERQQFGLEMKKRLNKIRLFSLKNSLKFRSDLEKRGLSEQERLANERAMAGVVRAGIGTAIASIGPAKTPETPETPTSGVGSGAVETGGGVGDTLSGDFRI